MLIRLTVNGNSEFSIRAVMNLRTVATVLRSVRIEHQQILDAETV
jgi:hypothetical protein